jgi:hypothetical protein
LTADEILDIKLGTKPSKPIVAKDKKKEMVRKTVTKDKLTADEKLDLLLGTKSSKPIVAKDKSARTQNNFSRQLTADELLDIKLGTMQSKTIVAKDKEKLPKENNVSKSMADGKVSNPNKLAIGDGPKTTNAPKMSQTTTEETVVSSKEMQFWQGLETQQIIKKIIDEYPRHKKVETLSKMRKPTLLKYVMQLEASRNRVGQRNRTVRVK